jgi:hypothetical protein
MGAFLGYSDLMSISRSFNPSSSTIFRPLATDLLAVEGAMCSCFEIYAALIPSSRTPPITHNAARLTNNLGSQGIEANIAHQLQQAGGFLAQDGFVSVLEQVALAPMPPVNAQRITVAMETVPVLNNS